MELRKMSDATLVELTLLGNGDAYSELVTRHQKAVLNTARAVCGNNYTAEDAAQDAFVTAWTKLDTLADRASFRAWVCAIARNRARRLAVRYREYVPLEEVENVLGEYDGAVEEGFELELLRDAVKRLSDRVRRVIDLFYFQGLSLSEIAARESITVAAVKSRLHEGRMKLRKEMGYMANEYETLPEAVARRLEEIKKWKYKSNLKGFSADYESLLAELRALPDTAAKYHALADLLLRGVWWLEGEKQNEALMKELEDAAYKGDNKEVIKFILRREEDKLSGDELIKFILETQIPKFEQLGMTEAVGEEWLRVGGHCLVRGDNTDKAREALEKAAAILPDTHFFRGAALASLDALSKLGGIIGQKPRYDFLASGLDIEYEGEKLLLCMANVHGGWYSQTAPRINAAALVDSILLCGDLKKGETYHGSHPGDEITLADDDATVPACGREFVHCYEYVIKSRKHAQTVTAWFKRGVGMVAFETIDYPELDPEKRTKKRVELSEYKVNGGGLLPLCAGNKWSYAYIEPQNKVCEYTAELEVLCADGKTAHLKMLHTAVRNEYGETWQDSVDSVVNWAWSGNQEKLSKLINNLRSLARTDWQRELGSRLADYEQKLADCDEDISPASEYAIGWARFNVAQVTATENLVGIIDTPYSGRWMPKDWTYSAWLGDIYGILQDRMGALWRGGWTGDVRFDKDFAYNWMNGIDLRVTGAFHYAGSIPVKAGKFDNCMVLSTQVLGGIRNAGYRLHDADYYFADGVGLVKIITHCGGFLGDVIYELADYKGTGKGFFPTDAGLTRRYVCTNSHVGYESESLYVFANDDNGERRLIFAGIGRHNKAIAAREERGNTPPKE